ncbi:MAG: alpha-galactosidase [Lentisphaeria bacterium]|nr:alpha-galactosidase [Lentisphaeria bacterium]
MYLLKDFRTLLEEGSPVKPFSFLYDGKEPDLGGVKGRVVSRTGHQLRIVYDVVPEVLRVSLEVNVYADFPAIEYTPYLENIGNADTGIVSEFCSLDLTAEDPLTFGEQKLKDDPTFRSGRISVRYHLGSNAAGTDFLPQRKDLFPRPGCNRLELECQGGWCSTMYLPYFGIDTDPMNGLNLAVGWNGAWKFSVEKECGPYPFGCGRKSRIRCGMSRSHFRLRPGEKLMQPGILLHFREGKSIRDGQNQFRRFILAHNSPRDSRGELLKPPLSLGVWGGLETAKQLSRVQVVQEKQLPYEEWWIDAGWMGASGPCPHFLEDSPIRSDWPFRVGSWEFNRYAHPDGFRPISDAVHRAGMRLLVWFETERVSSRSGASVLTEHPEWLLGHCASSVPGKSEGNFLLDLGNPEAREYLLNTICGIIDREGIDDYREDFNMDAGEFWVHADAPDRIGVTEMKYVEGFYLYWGELRKRYPDMFIDNCSGGGRRLDYKTAALSFPLCQSDYACYLPYEEECIQLENLYLDDWIPLHGTWNWGEDDPYHAFSGMGCGYASKIWQFNGREPKADHDYCLHRKILEWGKRLRDLHLKGDVYPLAEAPELDLRRWNGQQVHDPAGNCGMVMVFRRKNSPDPEFRPVLSGLDPDAVYETEFFSGEKRQYSGRELASLTIRLNVPRTFQIIRYEQIKKEVAK